MSFQPEDFPILCETCLGDNPYLRMTRERFAKACKICDRPITVYRWRPGPRSRFKKTEICGTCAKLKNVCQTCILDLQYGLPVQVRDEALSREDETAVLQTDVLPVSRPNRNYMYEQLEHQVGLGGNNTSLQLPYQQLDVQNGGNAMLQRIQRRGPYYKRNLPHICSFYVAGTCNRGDACPYRHVHPSQDQKDDALKDQNIKDRFYGVNDPVANKLINKYEKWMHGGSGDEDGNSEHNKNKNRPLPEPPTDTTVRTLFIGGIDWSMNEDLIRDKLQSYGEILSVVLLHDKKCAFVTFATREMAEQTMTALFDQLYLNKRKCQLNWARPKNEQHTNQNNNNNSHETDKEETAQNDKHEKDDAPPAGQGEKESAQTDNQNEKSGHVESDEVDVTQLTEDEKTYLRTKGIMAPALPPLPDASAVAQNVPYVAKRGTQYQSMTEHYNEAKV
eukprot:CAMPEP_0202688990 /NCGR_PEP_ID=MMETSP1385-20130828/4365_1 /ASSEMBLY_ACC=CAM_ASM_000861 /TAXON_ID=933848 /ORGANISM="Elphidium margaritaceum" /LENGTH=446 /DNA_ID=CAMNT_0049344063 /DNA_START=44 /DNA_END=1384 /DNA_ORIENTATION=+